MNLNQVKPGQSIKIDFIPEDLELRLFSLGIKAGDSAECISRSYYGPVVLRKDRAFNQVAITHRLAENISVTVK
jgi:Fe2+ transport system protein FeoA